MATPPVRPEPAARTVAPADDTPPEGRGFFSRWSQRKALVARGGPAPEPAAAPAGARDLTPAPGRAEARIGSSAAPGEPPEAPEPVPVSAPAGPGPTAQPAPTLDDVARLDVGADVRRFVAPGVDRSVANAALKKLFADPHFNIMDGLDTYIEDYGRPDPLPAGMLEKMAMSQFVGLFTEAPAPAGAPQTGAPGTVSPTTSVPAPTGPQAGAGPARAPGSAPDPARPADPSAAAAQAGAAAVPEAGPLSSRSDLAPPP